jgi:hypothetical protein
MVRVKTIKEYHDIELDKKVQKDFEQEVSIERARKLTSMGLVEILRIDKLSKK